MSEKHESAYVSAEEAAEYFGIDIEHMRRLCREKKIPGARKLGRVWRIPRIFLTTDIDSVQQMADEGKQ